MLILQAFAATRRHGFGVAKWIHASTRGKLKIDEGALYPALHRMERKGWIESDWGVSENNRRAKYYRITATGLEQLTRLRGAWIESSMAVDEVLRAVP